MNALHTLRPGRVYDPAMPGQPGAPAPDDSQLTDAARAGDASAFAQLTERFRRQLHVHAYRMLGSVDDADDIVQETFLRAWQGLGSFEGRSLFRTWLYRIATNLCLNVLERRPRRFMPPDLGPPTDDLDPRGMPEVELPWLQPYPDRLLDAVAPAAEHPEALAISRETIEVAYLAAIQHLPPRQRAVLVLRDALTWSARDTAEVLGTSVASVNSALQRARATLRARLPERRSDWTRSTDVPADENRILRQYVEAAEHGDAASLIALLRDDVRQTMPPLPAWWEGKATVAAVNASFFDDESIGPFRVLSVAANRQPAAAIYVRAPGDTEFRLVAIDVLRIEEGGIAEIDTFDAARCPGFDLPATFPN